MLWSGYGASAIAPVTERLLKSVRTLQATFATVRIDPLEIGLRAHEILENAVQFELTGRADAGSGTDLATVSANIDGTRAALAPLREILATRYPELAKADAWLTRSAAVVASFHRKDGSWAPVESLSRSDRERLNATLGETVELLAPIASICDIRRAT
jgi:iron uptake system component EfeO